MSVKPGVGMYIWNVRRTEGGDAEAIGRVAVEAGLSHAWVKIADGTRAFNVGAEADLARLAIEALKSAGVQVFGWQYVYGWQPEAEADAAIRRIVELGVDGFVVNAEVEYKHRPGQASRYMRRLRGAIGDMPVGLSSYRFPRIHPEFPWNAFLDRCDFNAPQVYWMQAINAAGQLRESIRQFQQGSLARRPIIPTGAAFQEHGWRPTALQVEEFLREADATCEAVNFWAWEHARRLSDIWAVIRDFEWGEPGHEPEPPPDGAVVAYRAMVDGLNVRRMPSISGNTPVRTLRRGEVVRMIGAGGSDAWIEIAPGEFVALRTGGRTYLERVES
ncbi:MAG: hypothetical protein AB1453_03885 [Chloroflexota bacterium]